MNKIKVSSLSKFYLEQPVIDQLSFEVEEGERMALFAPSGAGKTTLIKILAGLEKTSAGTYSVEDRSPSVLFQEPRLFAYMTVEENIRLPWKLRRQKWSVQEGAEFEAWLDICELSESRHKYPYQLSGGMRQKAALIRGLLWHPRLVLMDEPFNSIGIEMREKIIDFLKIQNPGLTMLMATHNLEEIALLADSVLYFSSNCLASPHKVSAATFIKKYAGFFEDLIATESGNSCTKRRINDYSSQFITMQN